MVMEETANYAVAERSEGSLLKSLTFAIAMSFHSILEGFALGVQDTPARIVTLFISLILHKGIEAFSVGLQISKGNSDKIKQVIATILVYALMTPIGSGLGTLLQNTFLYLCA
uniref:Zinc transporter ZIP1 n=1 Tax=Heterorhabditis bacteriophora TaxID=37862 RepID=A0A1I7WPX4_HETBA